MIHLVKYIQGCFMLASRVQRHKVLSVVTARLSSSRVCEELQSLSQHAVYTMYTVHFAYITIGFRIRVVHPCMNMFVTTPNAIRMK